MATLTLNRPHRHNAWNPVLERRFYQLLDEACRDDRVRAVVLTGPDFREGIDSFIQKRPPEFPPLRADLSPADITGATISALTIDPMNP